MPVEMQPMAIAGNLLVHEHPTPTTTTTRLAGAEPTRRMDEDAPCNSRRQRTLSTE